MSFTEDIHRAGQAWAKQHNPYSERTVEHGDWNKGFQLRVAGLAPGSASQYCSQGYDAAGSFLITKR